jgi:hypothetical protein
VADLKAISGGGAPPRHPTIAGDVPLIVRLGLHDDRVLREFDGFGMPVVAHTILQNEAHSGLAFAARERYGLALLIDPENHLNQVEPKLRRKSFAHAAYAVSRTFDPRSDRLEARAENRYAVATLEEQRRRRATVLVTPYHVVGGLDCEGRKADLRLARASARHFRTMQWHLSPPGERFPIDRELYAGFAVHPKTLREPLELLWLVSQYAELPVDGYYVKIAGLSDNSSLADIANCAELLLRLQGRARRPVVLSGGGNLWMALLAEGLAAACIGLGEGEVFHFPPSSATGRQGRPVYHDGLVRSVNPKAEHEEARRRAQELFRRFPCACGHHPKDRAPKGRERKPHTFSLRYADASIFSMGPIASREAHLAKRLLRAREIALAVGYSAPTAGFERIVEVGQRVRRRERGVAEDDS